MKRINSYFFIMLLFLVVSCGKENPFEIETDPGKGILHKSAIGIDLRDDEFVQTKADDSVNIDDFKITIFKEGSTTPVVVYRYGDMPEIVTLDKGTYKIRAEHGEDVEADWNSPYFAGESEAFTVLPEKITDDIGTIVCRLENVKVSIVFAPKLTEQMSDDSSVEVRVSESGTAGGSQYLRFSKNDQLRGNCGYFRHVEGVSLVATFRGVVEGLQTVRTKTYDKVQKGCHYKITFKLNTQELESKGYITGGLGLDATVTVTDVERNIDIEEEEILGDEERPREDDPAKPDDPTPPGPQGWSGPTVVAEAPLTLPPVSSWTPVDGVVTLTCSQDITLNDPNVNVVLKFESADGFDEFYADIVSDNLSDDELQGVGLSSHLDLVNPASPELAQSLTDLNLPVYIGGEKSADFDISDFMPLLSVFGANSHKFVIHVKDAKGEIIVNLILNFK